MKTSTRGLFVLLAVVISLTGVQAVSAHLESIEGPYTVVGTVAYVWGDRVAIACGYEMDPDAVTGCPFMVSGMGPAGWWSVNDVTFPAEGAEVTIDIYRVTTSVGNIRYVAGEVLDNGEEESILLHVPVYDGDVIYVLDPAWSKMEPVAEATILSAVATKDSDFICRCDCNATNGTCDCVCEPDDCIPVGDEHKWKGEK